MKSISTLFESIKEVKPKVMTGAKLLAEKTFEQMICVAIMMLVEILRH